MDEDPDASGDVARRDAANRDVDSAGVYYISVEDFEARTTEPSVVPAASAVGSRDRSGARESGCATPPRSTTISRPR